MSQPTPLQRMETAIGNSVSEAEVEAAARPIADLMYSDHRSAEGYGPASCDLSRASAEAIANWVKCARSVARAALTAAAQVRAQADNRIPGLKEAVRVIEGMNTDWPDAIGSLKGQYGGQFVSRIRERILILGQRTATNHAIMPIYGATEDTKEDLVQATNEPAEADRDHPATDVGEESR